MGRPAKHNSDDFIDAAVAIFAASGVRAVTLAAVADKLGAANGSIYYRFPDRAALLQTLWVRTTERFRDGYREALGERPTISDAIDTVGWVVEWCRDNPEQAQVLQAGARTFVPDGQSAQGSDTADVETEVRGIVAALADHTAATRDQIAFAMTELPLAVVRRHLQAGRAPGEREIELARSLASVILARSQLE